MGCAEEALRFAVESEVWRALRVFGRSETENRGIRGRSSLFSILCYGVVSLTHLYNLLNRIGDALLLNLQLHKRPRWIGILPPAVEKENDGRVPASVKVVEPIQPLLRGRRAHVCWREKDETEDTTIFREGQGDIVRVQLALCGRCQ